MIKAFLRKKISAISKQYNEIDTSVEVSSDCYMSGSILKGKVVISEGCKLHQVHIEGDVHISRYTSLWGPNIFVFGRKHGIQIGSFCSIARNVSIQEDYHNPERLSTYFFETNILDLPAAPNCIISKGKVEIGNDVWIGAGASILSGVKVGNGAIIASNAVITKNVPDFAIMAGNPAKIIKYRFSTHSIEKIQEMKWWDWSIEKIKKEKQIFLENFA